MTTLLDRLQDFKAAGDAWLDKTSAHSVPIPECLQAYRDFIATGAYPYHAKVVEYMREQFNTPSELDKALHTQNYICSKLIDAEKAKEIHEKLIADGWTPIISQTWLDIPTTGRAELRLDNSDEMFGGDRTLKCRLGAYGQGGAFFLPG